MSRVLALLVGAFPIGFALFWREAAPLIAFAVFTGLCVAGWAVGKLAQTRVKPSPRLAIYLVELSLLRDASVVGVLGGLALLGGIEVAKLDTGAISVGTKEIATAAVGLITGLVAGLVERVKDPDKFLGERVKCVFRAELRGQFEEDEQETRNIVMDDENSLEGKKGWGWGTRRKRADAVAKALDARANQG